MLQPGLRRPPRHLPIFCTTCKATTTLRGKWPLCYKPAQVGKRPLQRWSASSNWELRIKFCSEPMFILPKWPWRSRGNCHWGTEWVLNARCQFCGWGMRGGSGQLRSLSWLTRCSGATPHVNPKCESQRASVYAGHGSALFSVVLHNPSDCLNTSREHLENKCSCMRTCET